jgi:alpha-L-fucosidase
MPELPISPHRFLRNLFAGGLLFLLLALPCRAGDVAPETKAHRDARMAWWRQARFGMFIHWGLFSVSGGSWKGQQTSGFGEWIMHDLKIPVADYKAQVSEFNPTKFDADQWVSIAKAAGMKYIVVITKHHEGFAMFKSSNPFNIADATPFQRDTLKELAAACKRQGLHLGFYYSQDQDWTAPGGAAFGGHWDKAQDGDFAAYIKTKVIPQLDELLTNYKPYPDVIWFDTPTGDMTPELAGQIREELKKHPGLIWNNRLGSGDQGDTDTPEGMIPANGYDRDWETCMNINDTWGYKAQDTNWKSTETLLRNLIDICSKGGNYLLNVGPTGEGVIPQPEVDRLLAIGKWLEVNGSAIYGTTASPFQQQLSWGRTTQKPGKLFLSVFNWPQDGKLDLPLSNHINRAYLLTAPTQTLITKAIPNGVEVDLPPNSPDPVASVVVLEFTGNAIPVILRAVQSGDGKIILSPETSSIRGTQLRVENSPPNLGAWMNSDDYAQWDVAVKQPGDFKVEIDYALDPASKGSSLVLQAGEQSLAFEPAPTDGWTTYQKLAVGNIHLGPGKTHFILRGKLGPLPSQPSPVKGVINLRSITLEPSSAQ